MIKLDIHVFSKSRRTRIWLHVSVSINWLENSKQTIQACYWPTFTVTVLSQYMIHHELNRSCKALVSQLVAGEKKTGTRNHTTRVKYQHVYTYIQVVPGRAGGGSFRRKKNYIAKKEFAYRMCARRPTSAMPKPFLCCERAFCCSMVVTWPVLMHAMSFDVVVMSFDAMWLLVLCHVTWCNAMSCDVRSCDVPCNGHVVCSKWFCDNVVIQSTILYYKVLLQYYSVLQSTTPVLLCTTQYYNVLLQYYSVLQSTTPVLLCTTQYYNVLLCTTKYYSSTTLYYTVLQRTTPVLPCTTKHYSSTTLYCKVLLQYYSVLQSTTPVLLCTTQYYNVLLQYYSVLKYYSSTTLYYKAAFMIDPWHIWTVIYMIDVRRIWNVIYNARSNRSHPPTSPNTAPATQNDCDGWSASHMKRHLQCVEQQESHSNFTK